MPDHHYSNGEQHHNGYKTRQFHTKKFRSNPNSQHDGIEIFHTPKDPQLIRVGKRDWQINTKKLVILNANIPHGVSQGDGHFTSLTISSDRMTMSLHGTEINVKQLHFPQVEAHCTPTLTRCLDEIFALRQAKIASAIPVADSDAMVEDCALTTLIVELLTTAAHSQSPTVRRLMEEGRYPQTIDKAKTVLHDLAFCPDLDLAKLARVSGCSKFQLVRNFKAKTGCTPIKYRNILRVAAAKQKLSASMLPIAVIAHDVGFSDLSTFNKTFRKVVGVSPTAYRSAINS